MKAVLLIPHGIFLAVFHGMIRKNYFFRQPTVPEQIIGRKTNMQKIIPSNLQRVVFLIYHMGRVA